MRESQPVGAGGSNDDIGSFAQTCSIYRIEGSARRGGNHVQFNMSAKGRLVVSEVLEMPGNRRLIGKEECYPFPQD